MTDITPDHLRELVLARLPDAKVKVGLFSGDDHFEMEVVWPGFSGKSRVAQHQIIYAALGDNMRQAVHALALKTRAE
ncbi:MAG TPA: BolA/IbaG family iron-sulfur metabolism protein [Mariprofundaceae bacterium]|nr:BolA/IbaG family iron-sulfur metabolism protein [Mariprofundaceae bacterium]